MNPPPCPTVPPTAPPTVAPMDEPPPGLSASPRAGRRAAGAPAPARPAGGSTPRRLRATCGWRERDVCAPAGARARGNGGAGPARAIGRKDAALCWARMNGAAASRALRMGAPTRTRCDHAMDARRGHPAAARAGALCLSGCGAQPLQRRKVWDCTWRSGLASWMRRRSGSVSISTKVPRQRGHSAEPCPFRPNRPCAGTRIIVTARHTLGQSHQVWQGGCCELARAGAGLDLAGEERRRARGDYPAAVVAIQRLRLLRRLRDCVRRGGAECNRGRASHPGRDAKPAGLARRGG